jgi:hypothetical protein
MRILLGLSHTGYRNFIEQKNFVVHYLRANPGMALCRRRVPYRFNFSNLPRNAIVCDQCRTSPLSS